MVNENLPWYNTTNVRREKLSVSFGAFLNQVTLLYTEKESLVGENEESLEKPTVRKISDDII